MSEADWTGRRPPHAQAWTETLAELGSDRRGLSRAEATDRLATHGPDTLPHGHAPGLATCSACSRCPAHWTELLIMALSLLLVMEGHKLYWNRAARRRG